MYLRGFMKRSLMEGNYYFNYSGREGLQATINDMILIKFNDKKDNIEFISSILNFQI